MPASPENTSPLLHPPHAGAMPNTAEQAFANTRFVLVAPRMAANVGSTARAMKTMGFSQLILVRPPEDGHQATYNFKLDHPEAVALASGALDVLTSAQIVDTLDEALQGCQQSVALSARPREWSGAVVQLPQQVANAASALQGGGHMAYVFGNERFGLSNEDVSRCSAICTINVNPDYSSLNLSQAVQVVAYSQRLAIVGEDAIAKTNRVINQIVKQGNESNPDTHSPTTSTEPSMGLSRELASEIPATHEQIQGLTQHWLDVMQAAGYYDPALPRRMKERLGSVWGRSQLTTADVDMLRGMVARLGRKD